MLLFGVLIILKIYLFISYKRKNILLIKLNIKRINFLFSLVQWKMKTFLFERTFNYYSKGRKLIGVRYRRSRVWFCYMRVIDYYWVRFFFVHSKFLVNRNANCCYVQWILIPVNAWNIPSLNCQAKFSLEYVTILRLMHN